MSPTTIGKSTERRRPSVNQPLPASTTTVQIRTQPNKSNAPAVQSHRTGLNKPERPKPRIAPKTQGIMQHPHKKRLFRQPAEHSQFRSGIGKSTERRRPSVNQPLPASTTTVQIRTQPNKSNAPAVQSHRTGLNKPERPKPPIARKTQGIMQHPHKKLLVRQPAEHFRFCSGIRKSTEQLRPSVSQPLPASTTTVQIRTQPNKPNTPAVQSHRTGLNKPERPEPPIARKTQGIMQHPHKKRLFRQPAEHSRSRSDIRQASLRAERGKARWRQCL